MAAFDGASREKLYAVTTAQNTAGPRRLAAVAFILCLSANRSPASTIYVNDFTVGAGAEWSDPTVIHNGEHYLADAINGSGNGTNTLSLLALPAHSDVTVEFDLYIINTWDGNGPIFGPDNWHLTADAANVLFTNFANFSGSNNQAYTNQLPPFGPGGEFAPTTGAFELGHLSVRQDSTTYRFSFNFAHAAPSIVLAFTSFQSSNANDEGWGLDNVRVSITADEAVPEPSGLLLAGLALIGAVRPATPWASDSAYSLALMISTTPRRHRFLEDRSHAGGDFDIDGDCDKQCSVDISVQRATCSHDSEWQRLGERGNDLRRSR